MGIWDNNYSKKKDSYNSNSNKNKDSGWGNNRPNETSTWVVNVDKKGNSSWTKKSEKREWF